MVIKVKLVKDKRGNGVIGKDMDGKVYFIEQPRPAGVQEGDWWEGEVIKETPRWGAIVLTRKVSGKYTYKVITKYCCGHETVEEKTTYAPTDSPPADKIVSVEWKCDACAKKKWEEQRKREEEKRKEQENAWLQIKKTVLQMLLAPHEPTELACLPPPPEPQWVEEWVKRTIYDYEKEAGDVVVEREERMEWEPYKWELERTTQMPGGEHGRAVKKVYLTVLRRDFRLANREEVKGWEEMARRVWENLPPAVRAYAAIKANSCPQHGNGMLCPNDTLYDNTAQTHIPIHHIIFSPHAYLTLYTYAKKKGNL